MTASTRPNRARRNSRGAACLVGLAAIAAGPRAHAAAQPLAAVAPSTQVDFDVMLPLRDTAGLDALIAAQQSVSSPQYHQWLTPAQFGTRFGPDAATMASVAATLRAAGFSVTPQSRSLHVTGSAAAVGRMFSTTIGMTRLASGAQRVSAMSRPVLPAALASAGAMLPTLEPRAIEMHTYARRVAQPDRSALPDNRKSADGGYYFPDLKQAYQYPSYQTFATVKGKRQRLDGTGATIGVVISSQVNPADLAADFDHENWTTTTGAPDPKLYKYEPVGAGAPAFDVNSNGSFEATLDVHEEVTGAPGAHVVLYGIPDLSDQSVIAGYTQVVNDNTTDLVSSSFGECELYYTAAYNGGTDFTYLLTMESQIYKQGNAEGISFLASSGDEAGLECATPSYVVNGTGGSFIAGVSTPAADPNVTAVGGTNVVTTYTAGSLNSAYVGENAYSDPEIPYDQLGVGALASGGYWGAGGGVSTLFSKPAYQYLAYTGSLSKRTLPDVGMQVGGCPGSISQLPCNGGNQPIDGNGNTDRSYVILSFGGTRAGVIGTSVSSPEFAGVNAMLIELYGRQGNLNNYIYALAATQLISGFLPTSQYYHQNIPGYNGVVSDRTPGGPYNFTSGVGTPIVYHYLNVPFAATAGVPQTISNP